MTGSGFLRSVIGLLLLGCSPPASQRSFLLDFVVADSVKPANETAARAAFEQLKSLEGNWVGSSGGMPASATYSVSSQGSVVLERLTVEDPIEMVTVYHLDRGRLVAEHFCMNGTQPRLYLDSTSTPGALSFAFAGATNLRSPTDGHMHGGRLTWRQDGELVGEWLGFHEGKPGFTATISLRRAAPDSAAR
jgi:hypothetical protein